jgi:hypothetical protein
MNPAMQDQYATFLLRRNWKGAVQVLKAALEVDPGDAAALSQMEDQRTRFLQQAGSLINEARGTLSTGNGERLQEVAGKLDSQFPEWMELAESDEVLAGLWEATRMQAPVAPEPEEEPEDGEALAADRETLLRDLLQRADPKTLGEFDMVELGLLEKELAEAEVSFALGVPTGSVAKRQVSAALTDVHGAISTRRTRVVLRNAGIGIVVALLLAAAAVYYFQREGAQPAKPSAAEQMPPGASPIPGQN